MFTRLVGSTLAAVLLVAGGLTVAQSDAQPAGSTAVVDVATQPIAATSAATAGSRYEARILTLVNRQRARHGLRALRPLACPDRYANRWAAHMARVNSMYHQSLMPILSSCRATGAGENVAMGNVSADEMMAMWMASPGHRKNILRKAFTHIGVGAARTSSGRWYGAQDFVRR